MEVIKIISEWKGRALSRRMRMGYEESQHPHHRRTYPKAGYKRVEAIVKIGGQYFTRHLDVRV